MEKQRNHNYFSKEYPERQNRNLWIDDNKDPDYGTKVEIVRDYDSAIQRLKEGKWNIVYLDYDLGNKTGIDILNFLADNLNLLPNEIRIISYNSQKVSEMSKMIEVLYLRRFQ